MKITHKVTTETDFTDDIICNKCGKSCFGHKSYSPEGLIEVHVRGGYGSAVIGDGDTLTFSLCERCLVPIILDFKIPPDYHDHHDQDATFGGWSVRAAKALKRKDEREPWKS